MAFDLFLKVCISIFNDPHSVDLTPIEDLKNIDSTGLSGHIDDRLPRLGFLKLKMPALKVEQLDTAAWWRMNVERCCHGLGEGYDQWAIVLGSGEIGAAAPERKVCAVQRAVQGKVLRHRGNIYDAPV